MNAAVLVKIHIDLSLSTQLNHFTPQPSSFIFYADPLKSNIQTYRYLQGFNPAAGGRESWSLSSFVESNPARIICKADGLVFSFLAMISMGQVGQLGGFLVEKNPKLRGVNMSPLIEDPPFWG